MAGPERRDHDAIGQACIERPVRRLQMKFQSALVAPTLQFDHPVALPYRVALHQGQAAGLRKQIDQHHRPVIYLEIISTYQIQKRLMPDIGPGRLEREIVIDLTRHAGSGTRDFRFTRSIPTDRPNGRKIDPCGNTAALRSRVHSVAGSN